jgi:hypothetical protein
MRARVLNASMLIAALAIVGVAQSRPDFSGTWVPVDDVGTRPPLPPSTPDGPPPPPPPPRTISLAIRQSAGALAVDRRVEERGHEVVYAFLYKLDGSESINQMGLLTFHTRAAWDGESLVLSSGASVEGNALGELRETYRLVDGTLVVESVRKSPAGTFTGRTIHARRD